MSGFSSQYLSTRLDLFSGRLISYPQLVGFIDYDLERILAEIRVITGNHYDLEFGGGNDVESRLTRGALQDFQVLMRPYSGNERRFFFFTIRWFELANLKLLIRGKFSGVDNAEIRRQLVDLGDFADLPLSRLIETDDPHEMLRLLETTAYAGIVRQARRVYEEQGHDLFLLDATIDRVFFIDLEQRTRFLHEEDAAFVARVLDELLDRYNLLWLLRYRFAYELSPARSFYLLTTTGRKLNATRLMQLVKLDSIEAVIAALPDPYRERLAGLARISDMETVMEYHALTVAADMLRTEANLVARTFSYILLREAEVRFLQAIIKGKRLELDRALIRQAVGVGS